MAQKNPKAKKDKTQALLQDDTLQAAASGDPQENAPVTKTGPRDVGRLGKTDLADQLANRCALGKKDARATVDAFVDIVAEALRTGRSVGLPGIGTLSVRATAARTGVRPGTSERIQIPAGKKVAFKAASDLKGALGLSDANADDAGE
ncbi:HU family DNA-binding protein [Deinococcus yavapaiensis]|uniref:DNA-binding protein HU-beta n=1 Tax=Deinococcus yavapaiensis KR-236 TaxID=694435 RepID=A0A318S2P4_9DEIO|nr:HU family DNA-binding protein [Deinococcus yavapaiensis]PYE52722.1 DNA-binding protein HU-beta [Deinococcus yavapaiensis KR-236]